MKILIILSLSYILFIHNLGTIALWDPDEPRQAIMAREMMERNDYIHPYLNGKPYCEKPPLYSWMIIMASKLRGTLDEFSSRIPAALSATCLLIITYFLARRFTDPFGSLMASCVLATNYQFLSNARESVMDMSFALFFAMAIWFGNMAIEEKKRWLLIVAFIASGCAILTKGPAGLILPAGILFIQLLVTRTLKQFFLPLAAGCCLALILSSIWFFLAGEEYWREFILRQNIIRYIQAFDHREDFFYYFHKLFFNFLPWSIILPFAIIHAVKQKYTLPLVWFLLSFLFFQFSTSKRAIYLLPLYPACAILCGVYIRDRWKWLLENGKTRLLCMAFAILLMLLPLMAIGFTHGSSLFIVTKFKEHGAALYAYSGILFLIACVCVYGMKHKRERLTIGCVILYLVVTGLFYNTHYMPIMDSTFKSPRLISDRLGYVQKDVPVYTYGFNSPGLIFYLGKPIQPFFRIDEIKDDKRDILLIVEDRPGMHIREWLEANFVEIGRARYEKENYTFYVRRHG